MAEQVGVFISHHHSPEENAFTERLKTDLRAAGADVWVDDDNITSDNFLEKINEGLAGRQWVVFVMTPHSLQSVWVKDEINAALTQVRKGRMRGVIPVMAQPCSEDDIPVLWDSLHRYDATSDYPAALAGLIRAMGLSGAPSSQPAHPPQPTQQPQWGQPAAQSQPGQWGTPPAQPTQQTPWPPSTQPTQQPQQPQWGQPAGYPAQPASQPQWGQPPQTAPATYSVPASNAPVIPPPGAGATVWYVDPSGKMGRRTIKEALSLAQPGDQVLILPGKYQEHVDIKKSVELIGYGRREDIVLEAAGGALFRGGIIVSTGQHAKVTNLTVRQQKFVGPGAISIEAGELEVSQCDLTTSNGAGVVCKKASVILRGTRIHDCPMQGLVVEGASATALVEESTISACCRTSGAAIYLKAGGKITMRRTRITDNFRFAIQIEAGGGGTFEDNDLRGNQKGVWETDPSGFEVVQARNLE